MTDDRIKNRTVYMLCRTNKPDDGTDIYIGSTSKPLCQRLCAHRYRAKNFIGEGYSENNRLYKRMNDVGIMSWQIIPLLTFACNQKTIRDFERQWVTATGAGLNTYSPITDRKEYKKEYDATYHKNNIQTKRYYCNICDIVCGSNHDLKNHLGTLKHSYAWLNAVD